MKSYWDRSILEIIFVSILFIAGLFINYLAVFFYYDDLSIYLKVIEIYGLNVVLSIFITFLATLVFKEWNKFITFQVIYFLVSMPLGLFVLMWTAPHFQSFINPTG